MAPQTVTQAGLLDERMQALVKQDVVNEFEIAQLRREAQTVRATFPDVAFMVLGFLSALQGNESEARANYAAAIRIKSDRIVHSNFSLSLHRLNCHSDALIEARHAHSLEPNSLDAADDLIARAVNAGAYQEAKAVLESREALRPQAAHPMSEFTMAAAGVMTDNHLSDHQSVAIQEIASQILRANKSLAQSTELLVQEDDETRWISVWHVIHQPVDCTVDLNEALALNLGSATPPLSAAKRIVHMYLSADQT